VRLLYVDRVTRLKRYESIAAALDLSPDEPIFAVHFPGDPILPASILIEAFAQAASILLETSSGFTLKAIPAYLENAKFRSPVRPPDTVEISMIVEQRSDDGALLRGRATQAGEVKAVCTMGMVTAPLSRFYRPGDLPAYRAMYGRLLAGACLEAFDRNPLAPLDHVPAG